MLKYMILLVAGLLTVLSCSEEEQGPDITAPDSVKNFRAMAEGTHDMKIQLAWNKSPEGDLAGYLLYRKQDAETQYVFLDTILEESYFDTVTSYSSRYSYEIFAFDNAGNVSLGNINAHSILSPNLFPPTPIDSLTLVPTNRGINKYCTFSWNPVDVDIKSYNIIKETLGATETKQTIIVPGTTSNYVDTAVVAGAKYRYSVLGVDFGDTPGLVNKPITDFLLTKPVLVSPNNDTVVSGMITTFVWNEVKSATSYEFILNQDKDLVDTVITAVVGSTMSLSLDLSTIDGIQSGMPLTWHILTYSIEGGEINSSADKKASFTYSK